MYCYREERIVTAVAAVTKKSLDTQKGQVNYIVTLRDDTLGQLLSASFSTKIEEASTPVFLTKLLLHTPTDVRTMEEEQK